MRNLNDIFLRRAGSRLSKSGGKPHALRKSLRLSINTDAQHPWIAMDDYKTLYSLPVLVARSRRPFSSTHSPFHSFVETFDTICLCASVTLCEIIIFPCRAGTNKTNPSFSLKNRVSHLRLKMSSGHLSGTSLQTPDSLHKHPMGCL